jgi:CRP-like cAMP-binding protein
MSTAALYSGPNRLLASLSHDDFGLLYEHLVPISLTRLQPLEVANEIPHDIYFPEGSVASVVATLRSQKNFEVGLIGWDGMTGSSVLDGAPSPFDCYVQFVGPALKMPTRALISALQASPTLRAALNLFAHVLSVQTAYTALASAHAPLPERLARWLLMIDDRVDGPSFNVTHDLLSIMLGVRRPGVTTALHELEGEGLIKSTRGRVEILDRDGLRTRAGNAYGKTERSYDELIEAVDPDIVTLKLRADRDPPRRAS